VEYPGAIYHVMNRGDRREPIFRDEEDRKLFLATLVEGCGKTDWQVHAWWLMCLITFSWWWEPRRISTTTLTRPPLSRRRHRGPARVRRLRGIISTTWAGPPTSF